MLEGLRQLSVYRIAAHGTKMWFFNQSYRSIIELDKNEMTPHIVWLNDKENLFKQGEYGGVVWDNDRLIFAPRNTDKIMIYELAKGNVTLIPIDVKKANGLSAVFSDVYIYKDNAFFFPGRYRAIIKMNLKTYEIQYIGGWEKVIEPLRNDISVFSKMKSVDENTCLLPCWQKGIIIEFSMDNLSWKVHEICEGGISDVIQTKGGYWIIQKDKYEIIKTNECFEVVGKYKFVHEKSDPSEGFLFAIKGDKKLFLFPFGDVFVAQFDEQKEEFSYIDNRSTNNSKLMGSGQHIQLRNTYISQYNETLHILFDVLCGKLLFFDSKSADINGFSLLLDDKEFREVSADWEYKYFEKNVRVETSTIGLGDFISFIKGEN